ncbi:MAG: hypothetical protein JRE16_06400 [Deltaproteobacteria bacterium]|jgi:hypothetical protein|nr:hypothetical protein [Deltaproteobacteria bacterium]
MEFANAMVMANVKVMEYVMAKESVSWANAPVTEKLEPTKKVGIFALAIAQAMNFLAVKVLGNVEDMGHVMEQVNAKVNVFV